MQRLISKQKLCEVFGLRSRGGHCYYALLKKYYFSAEALAKLGITPERYREIRGMSTFNHEESMRIIAHFKIESNELE